MQLTRCLSDCNKTVKSKYFNLWLNRVIKLILEIQQNNLMQNLAHHIVHCYTTQVIIGLNYCLFFAALLFGLSLLNACLSPKGNFAFAKQYKTLVKTFEKDLCPHMIFGFRFYVYYLHKNRKIMILTYKMKDHKHTIFWPSHPLQSIIIQRIYAWWIWDTV